MRPIENRGTRTGCPTSTGTPSGIYLEWIQILISYRYRTYYNSYTMVSVGDENISPHFEMGVKWATFNVLISNLILWLIIGIRKGLLTRTSMLITLIEKEFTTHTTKDGGLSKLHNWYRGSEFSASSRKVHKPYTCNLSALSERYSSAPFSIQILRVSYFLSLS